jgi:hypothetical protein
VSRALAQFIELLEGDGQAALARGNPSLQVSIRVYACEDVELLCCTMRARKIRQHFSSIRASNASGVISHTPSERFLPLYDGKAP